VRAPLARRSWPVLLLLAGTATAAEPPEGPVATAARTSEAIRIDGSLSEPAWQTAQRYGGFTQRDPHDGEPAELSTEFSVLFDDEALYVGIRAFDPQPETIRGLLHRRDEDGPSDWVWIGIDSYRDRRTAFVFAVNAAGVQRDLLVYDDSVTDENWDAVWLAAASIDDRGWSTEVRIPFGQLRFSGESKRGWGFQVGRATVRTAEESYWSPWPKSSVVNVGRYGTLKGVRGVDAVGRLELIPYALQGLRLAPDGDRPHQELGRFGLDTRYGLSRSLTLSATLLPDFGQVEADPSVVNLTAVETFFPEKRPFFLEGRHFFRVRLSQGDGSEAVDELFHSRRIGAPPRGEPEDELVEDLPEATTIYGAAKLTGRTEGGWSVAALQAVTAEERVRVRRADGREEDEVVEPLTSYSVLGLEKDLREGRTSLGVLLSGVHRDLAGTGMGWLHEQAYSGGAALSHKFADDEWALDAKVFGSAVLGSAEALDTTQQDAQHTFQRPDADHLDYDPHRTHLTGFSAQYTFGRTGGETLRGAIGGDTRSPGFEVNDLGFQQRADYAGNWIWLQLRDDEPGAVLREWRVNTNAWFGVDYGGLLTYLGWNANLQSRLLSYWSAMMGFGQNTTPWRPGELRGGPALRGLTRWFGWFTVISDPRRPVRGSFGGVGRPPDVGGSWYGHAWGELTLQAASNLELMLGPSVTFNDNDLQYVDAPEDARGEPHYVLGDLEQTTLALTLRANYTLSPALSLQVYAQPYLSAGRYSGYDEVVSPGAERYADRFAPLTGDGVRRADGMLEVGGTPGGEPDWSFELADFDFRQLRSNVVLRWEYAPGSALFLVWSHARTSEDTEGRFALGDEIGALADEPGEHVVLVKLSHWLGL